MRNWLEWLGRVGGIKEKLPYSILHKCSEELSEVQRGKKVVA